MGKPYSGKPKARFDEGALEMELLVTAPALYSAQSFGLTAILTKSLADGGGL